MQAADDWQGTVGKAVENLDSGGFLVDRPGVAQLVIRLHVDRGPVWHLPDATSPMWCRRGDSNPHEVALNGF